MESTTFNTSRLLWIVAATGLCAGLVAFNQKQQKPRTKDIPQVKNLDTIPKKKERKIINLDEALGDTDRIRIDVNIDNLNELAQIGPLIEKEIKTSLEKIDWKEINEQVNASVSKIDLENLKDELNELKEINLDKINVNLEHLTELKNIKPAIEINLKNLKIQMNELKVQLKEYKTFVDGLEKDGLINKKDGYTIKHKNGELIINGKVQPAGVYSKYRSFLEKHKSLNIENSDGDFNIDHD